MLNGYATVPPLCQCHQTRPVQRLRLFAEDLRRMGRLPIMKGE